MDTPTPVSEPANRIFVGNLSFRTTDQDLGQAFAGCGEIKSALVITRGRRSLGYGFVVFANATDAENAVEKHKNLKILDREVKLELAKNRDNIKPREERNTNNAGENQNQQGNNDSNQDQVPPKRRTRNRNRNRNRNNKGNNQSNQNFGTGYNQFQFPPNNNFNQPFPSGNRTYGSVVSGYPPNNFNNFNAFNPPFNQPSPFPGPNNRNNRRNRGPSNQGQNMNNTNVNNNFDDNFGNNGPRRRRRNQGGNQGGGNNQQRMRPEPREKIPSTTTLYVTNLPFSCTDEGLLEIFKDCKPKSAHIVFTRNGRSRGYGFVEFEDENAQKKAMEAKNGTDVPDGNNSRTIQVSVSHSTGKLADNDGQV
jgi:RNA recognition motif-containing protein